MIDWWLIIKELVVGGVTGVGLVANTFFEFVKDYPIHSILTLGVAVFLILMGFVANRLSHNT